MQKVTGTAVRVTLHPFLDDTHIRGFALIFDVSVSTSEGDVNVYHFHMTTTDKVNSFENLNVTVQYLYTHDQYTIEAYSVVIGNRTINHQSIPHSLEAIRSLKALKMYDKIPLEYRSKRFNLRRWINPTDSE